MENNNTASIDPLNKYKTHLRYIGIISVLVAFFMVKDCMGVHHQNELVNNIATYKDSAQHFKDKYGDVVSTNKSLRLDNQEQLKDYVSAISDTVKTLVAKYKKITSVTRVKEYVYIHDTIPIAGDPIPCDFKPFDIRKQNKDYLFRGTISRHDFLIDSLYVPNEQTCVMGEKKTGFLRREFRADLVNSNPYIKTTNLGSYTTNFKPKLYERPSVWGLIGIVTGFVVSTATRR